jgi:hypothetical protein
VDFGSNLEIFNRHSSVEIEGWEDLGSRVVEKQEGN